ADVPARRSGGRRLRVHVVERQARRLAADLVDRRLGGGGLGVDGDRARTDVDFAVYALVRGLALGRADVRPAVLRRARLGNAVAPGQGARGDLDRRDAGVVGGVGLHVEARGGHLHPGALRDEGPGRAPDVAEDGRDGVDDLVLLAFGELR